MSDNTNDISTSKSTSAESMDDKNKSETSTQEIIASAHMVNKAIGNRHIIKNLSLKVRRGKTFALLGPNGAGKTSTVRLLTGLYTADSGVIKLFGEELTKEYSDEARNLIGVQNDGSLYERLSVFENLNIWGQIYKMPKADLENRINELLDFFDLADRAKSKVSSLSKGMKQKLLLARAVLNKPKFLILDEPTSGLDPESNAKIIDYLVHLVREEAVSIFLCTHQLFGLERLIDDVAIIKSGEIIAQGAVADLIKEEFPSKDIIIKFAENPIVESILSAYNFEVLSKNEVRVELDDEAAVADLVRKAVQAGVDIYEVKHIEKSLNDLYFSKVKEAELDEKTKISAKEGVSYEL